MGAFLCVGHLGGITSPWVPTSLGTIWRKHHPVVGFRDSLLTALFDGNYFVVTDAHGPSWART